MKNRKRFVIHAMDMIHKCSELEDRMPVRGYKASNKDEYRRLNELLEASYKNADKDHRFITLHKEKPIEDGWSRIYEYIPGQDTGLPLDTPKFIAHVGIWRQPMQFGQAKIVNGGIRDVCSHPIARGKAFGLMTVKDARAFMFQNEVDISILFTGSHHFYNKNGWESGLTYQNNLLPHSEYLRWNQSKKSSMILDPAKIAFRCVENKDVGQLAQLYQATQANLYLAADRDEKYWQLHFETRPHRLMDFIVAEYDHKIIAYFRYYIQNIPTKEKCKEISLKEARTLPVFSRIGSSELDVIYQQFFRFVEEEALASGESIYQISMTGSNKNVFLQHLVSQGFKLEQSTAISMGHMVLVTNPYSFFTHITAEIQARATQKLLPEGAFAIKFENQGEIQGGVIISNLKGKCMVEVIKSNAEYTKAISKISDKAEFQNVSKLTLIALGIIKPEDLDSEELKLEGKAPQWFDGLFSNISTDMYEMDHF